MIHTQKLIDLVTKNSTITEGKESIGTDGVKYRYDMIVLNYVSASNWLVDLFEKAAVENGYKKYATTFASGDDSFNYDRPKYNNQPNGKIRISKLVILN
jgi:hypothetical protein